MQKSLSTRILSIILSLSLLVGMIPMPAAAAEEETVPTDYVDVLRMSFIEGDKLVAAAYGDDALAKDMHLGDKLYLQFTWPFNEEALDIEVIGPTSGALVGIPFLQHITPAYTDSERIYKPSGMTPFEIKVQLGLRSDYRELWAVPGLGYNGLPMSMWDQAGIALSNIADAMGVGASSDTGAIHTMSLTGGLAGGVELQSQSETLAVEEPAASESEPANDDKTPAPEEPQEDLTAQAGEEGTPDSSPAPAQSEEPTETQPPCAAKRDAGSNGNSHRNAGGDGRTGRNTGSDRNAHPGRDSCSNGVC